MFSYYIRVETRTWFDNLKRFSTGARTEASLTTGSMLFDISLNQEITESSIWSLHWFFLFWFHGLQDWKKPVFFKLGLKAVVLQSMSHHCTDEKNTFLRPVLEGGQSLQMPTLRSSGGEDESWINIVSCLQRELSERVLLLSHGFGRRYANVSIQYIHSNAHKLLKLYRDIKIMYTALLLETGFCSFKYKY